MQNAHDEVRSNPKAMRVLQVAWRVQKDFFRNQYAKMSPGTIKPCAYHVVGIHFGPKGLVMDMLTSLNGGTLRGLSFKTAARYASAEITAASHNVSQITYAWGM